MSIRSVSVENFKCFTELDLPCAPLTLLTGKNSAGKSTVLQALLLLSQGLRESPNVNNLSLNGELVELGSASSVVSRFSTTEGFVLGAATDIESAAWKFELRDVSVARGFATLIDIEYTCKEDRKQITDIRFSPEEFVSSELFRCLNEITFISAKRDMQLDTYKLPRSTNIVPGDVGRNGEYAPFWYDECSDDEVVVDRRHPSDQRETVRGQVDAWLSDFFPGARANIERLGSEGPIRLLFSLSQASPWSRPANVGFGISFAFPMIVSLLLANEGSTIIIDSAEAHLHPSAQSAVGRFLSRIASTGVQILTETHSDHLLNGVRLAVQEGTIEPKEVAIYFFDNQNGRYTPIRLEIDKTGNISDWPSGFFDQAEIDLAALSGWSIE